jgi:hypothetical protein
VISGRKVNILRGDSSLSVICEKNVHVVTEMALFESGCLGLRFLFMGLDEERSFQNKGGFAIRIVRWYFGCCCPPTET